MVVAFPVVVEVEVVEGAGKYTLTFSVIKALFVLWELFGVILFFLLIRVSPIRLIPINHF